MTLPVGSALAVRPADDDDIDARFDDANYAADAVDQLNRRLDLLASEFRSVAEMLAERIAQGFKRLEDKLDDYADASTSERKRLSDRVDALESSNTRQQRRRK